MKPSTAPQSFVWTRSETLALAQQSCTYCLGMGLRPGQAAKDTVCNCVLRAIFRGCYHRFRHCASKKKYICRVTLDRPPGAQRKSMWGRKNEEYLADFCLIAQRVLNEREHKIFRLHFLLGADWAACVKRIGGDRGTFFHDVYRIQQKLGRAFRETKPYPLFPTDEYFCGNRKGETDLDRVFPVECETPAKRATALRFPVRRAKASAA